MAAAPESVDDYLATLDPAARVAVSRIRAIVHEQVPDCEERVSYGVAGFRRSGRPFAYAGGFAEHVSVYPVPDLPEPWATQAARHRAGKGTLRFPLAEPLPEDLIREVVSALAARVG